MEYSDKLAIIKAFPHVNKWYQADIEMYASFEGVEGEQFTDEEKFEYGHEWFRDVSPGWYRLIFELCMDLTNSQVM